MNNKSKRKKIINNIIISILGILFVCCFMIIYQYNYNIQFINNSSNNKVTFINKKIKWSYYDKDKTPKYGKTWADVNYDNIDEWHSNNGVYNKDLKKNEKAKTVYFRYNFDLDNIENIEYMFSSVSYSDAVVIYLNGEIIFVGNVPSGGYSSSVNYGSTGRCDKIRTFNFKVTDLSALRKGNNCIAVELHQKSPNSKKIYFNMKNIKFHKANTFKKKSEYTVNLDGISFLPGKTNDSLEVNWFTNTNKFYQIEYMEKPKNSYTKAYFERNCTKYLMGQKQIDGEYSYLNTATLTRLKYDTDYIYRITTVGRADKSKIKYFHTMKIDEVSFLYSNILVEDIPKYYSDNVLKNVNFVISGTENYKYFITKFNENLNYNIPFVFINDKIKTKENLNFTYQSKTKQGDYYLLYQDTLFIYINDRNLNKKAHDDFVRNIIKKKNRKCIVLMVGNKYKNIFEKEFFKTVKSLNIDMVLTPNGCIYNSDKVKNLDKKSKLQKITIKGYKIKATS